MVLLDASRLGGSIRLLWGAHAQDLAPETTMQPHLRLRLTTGPGPDSSPTEAIAGDPLVLDAVLSPGGDRVAAVDIDRRLLVARVGGQGRVLAPKAWPGLAFSPSGSLLAFVCGWQIPETDLCLMDLDTGQHRPITRSAGPDNRPAFSPDGQHLLFISGRSSVASIWSAAIHETDARPTQITNTGLRGEDVTGPRFIPVPLGPSGPRAAGKALVFDTGEAVVSVLGERVRTLARTGAVILRAEEPSRGPSVLLLRPGTAGTLEVQTREVRP